MKRFNHARLGPVAAAVVLAVAAVWIGSLRAAPKSRDGDDDAQTPVAAERPFVTTLRLGWNRYLAGDYESALHAYRQASSAEPGAISPLLGIANCYAAQGDKDEAIQAALAVLAVEDTNYTAHRRLAEWYYERHEYADAEAHAQAIVDLYPEDLDVTSLLAWSQYYQGRVGPASERFAAILAVVPNHRSALLGKEACHAPQPE